VAIGIFTILFAAEDRTLTAEARSLGGEAFLLGGDSISICHIAAEFDVFEVDKAATPRQAWIQ
jgi:hypothetical protein